MTTFLQTLIDALAVGSIYALIALGYTMVYGVLQFINFAHGDVFMVGAWFSYILARAMGWAGAQADAPWWAMLLVLPLAMALCAVLGLVIERLAYRPLRRAPRLNVLISAIGVSLFLENLGQLSWLFGTQPAQMPNLWPDLSWHLGVGVRLRLVDVIGIGLTAGLMIALERTIYTTRFGLAMRAVSFDDRTAALMGVSVNRVISVTFVLGSSLAAAAGFVWVAKYPGINQPADAMWVLLGLKAFVAAVAGGIGNIRGAILGGLLIGAVEMFGAAYVSSNLRDVYVFSILILVLLLRPNGILGRPVPVKV